MTERREFTLVLLAGALLTLALTYPLAFNLGGIGRVDNGDGQFSIWNVAWVARALVTDPVHVFDANIFYPDLGTLAYSENNLGAGAVAIPVYWATRNPYAAHNFAVLVSFMASFIGMYYLVRHLTGDRRAAAISGIAFGFCPYMFAHTAQIHLLMIGGLPVVMLALHRFVDTPTMGRGAALGATMAIQALFCGYYGIFAILLVGYGVVVIFTIRRLWSRRSVWIALATGAILAMAIVLPECLPYVRVQRAGFGRTLEAAASFSATWSSFLASPMRAHVWMLRSLSPWSEAVFPGFLVTLLGVAGAWLSRRDRRGELLWLYGGLAVLACWASFGPSAKLYSVLYHSVPLFSWMRAPNRFGAIVIFSLCVLTGIAVARLAKGKHGNAIAWVFAAIAISESLVDWPMRPVEPLEPVYRVLRTLPSGPVIEMPFFYLDFMFPRHAYYMLQSTSHWMPIVNGYSDYMPPDFLEHAKVLPAFPSRDSLKVLEQSHVRYAIFHRYWYTDETWATVAPRMNEFKRYLRPMFSDDGTQLYEIAGFPP